MNTAIQYLSALDDTDDRPLNGAATVGTFPTSMSQLINKTLYRNNSSYISCLGIARIEQHAPETVTAASMKVPFKMPE